MDGNETRSARGASFCHVASSKQFSHEIDDMTWGNQKWHGAAPSFRVRLKVKIRQLIKDGEYHHIEILLSSIIADPNACARKYLIAPSVCWFWE